MLVLAHDQIDNLPLCLLQVAYSPDLLMLSPATWRQTNKYELKTFEHDQTLLCSRSHRHWSPWICLAVCPGDPTGAPGSLISSLLSGQTQLIN